MRLRRNIYINLDWVLIFTYLAMVLLGWLNIYAATYDPEHISIFDISQSYGKQLLWIVLALAIGAIVLLIEGQFIEQMSYPVYLVAIALLAGVLLFGVEIKGAKSWFAIGGTFRLQPAEFAKFATALAITKLLSGFNTKLVDLKTYLLAGVILLLPAGLIILQPDPGSALIYAAFVFVLYREGLSGNILLGGLYIVVLFVLALLLKGASLDLPFGLIASGKIILIAVIVVLAGLVFWVLKRVKGIWLPLTIGLLFSIGYVLSVDYVFDNVLSQRHRDRINETLGIISDPTGTGYNVHQSKIAIGSGGFSGKGYLQGTQTKYDFVPEQSTDFIFCTIGEEWGFIGSFVFILIYLFFLFRLIVVAERQKLRFTRIFGYCVAAIFFFHFAVNIGMTIGLAPVIGIPLPFFSYGGSSLWAFTLLLFTFIKMDSERADVLG